MKQDNLELLEYLGRLDGNNEYKDIIDRSLSEDMASSNDNMEDIMLASGVIPTKDTDRYFCNTYPFAKCIYVNKITLDGLEYVGALNDFEWKPASGHSPKSQEINFKYNAIMYDIFGDEYYGKLCDYVEQEKMKVMKKAKTQLHKGIMKRMIEHNRLCRCAELDALVRKLEDKIIESPIS